MHRTDLKIYNKVMQVRQRYLLPRLGHSGALYSRVGKPHVPPVQRGWLTREFYKITLDTMTTHI